jgi:hypothetical protein
LKIEFFQFFGEFRKKIFTKSGVNNTIKLKLRNNDPLFNKRKTKEIKIQTKGIKFQGLERSPPATRECCRAMGDGAGDTILG